MTTGLNYREMLTATLEEGERFLSSAVVLGEDWAAAELALVRAELARRQVNGREA